MTDVEPTLPPHELALVRALNRLGHLLVGRRIEADRAGAMTEAIEAMADEAEGWPGASKTERLMARNRISTFLETGEWPPPPGNGERIEFDPASVVGGELNPFAMGARYFRDGDEAVGRVTLGPCHEGPPDRVHGGVICAVFDEVLGCVFRATGTPSGFTGELSVRFEAPAPLGVELEFRGRQVGSKGRRQFLEGEAFGPDGRFATATGTFVQMTAEHLLAQTEPPAEPAPEPPPPT